MSGEDIDAVPDCNDDESANRELPTGAPPIATGLHLFPAGGHMATEHVDQAHAASIRQVLLDVEDALQALNLDGCDTSDVQELIDKTLAELARPIPNISTLGTYLNSVARSLRSQSSVRTVVLELDAVMRESNVPTTWEH